MRRMRNPNELFVGDLSFFCQEQHLFDLFSPFGEVAEARVKRSDKGGRTLMYGFVRMESLKSALDATKALNGHMLLGREIRVQLSLTNTYYDNTVKTKTGFPVQINIASQFNPAAEQIVEPNEEFLREAVQHIGEVVDVVVKDYVKNNDEPKQEGHAIVTFSTEDAAAKALSGSRWDIQGVSLECVKPANKAPQQSNSNNNKASAASVIESFASLSVDAHALVPLQQQQSLHHTAPSYNVWPHNMHHHPHNAHSQHAASVHRTAHRAVPQYSTSHHAQTKYSLHSQSHPHNLHTQPSHPTQHKAFPHLSLTPPSYNAMHCGESFASDSSSLETSTAPNSARDRDFEREREMDRERERLSPPSLSLTHTTQHPLTMHSLAQHRVAHTHALGEREREWSASHHHHMKPHNTLSQSTLSHNHHHSTLSHNNNQHNLYHPYNAHTQHHTHTHSLYHPHHHSSSQLPHTMYLSESDHYDTSFVSYGAARERDRERERETRGFSVAIATKSAHTTPSFNALIQHEGSSRIGSVSFPWDAEIDRERERERLAEPFRAHAAQHSALSLSHTQRYEMMHDDPFSLPLPPQQSLQSQSSLWEKSSFSSSSADAIPLNGGSRFDAESLFSSSRRPQEIRGESMFSLDSLLNSAVSHGL